MVYIALKLIKLKFKTKTKKNLYMIVNKQYGLTLSLQTVFIIFIYWNVHSFLYI